MSFNNLLNPISCLWSFKYLFMLTLWHDSAEIILFVMDSSSKERELQSAFENA